MLRFLMPSAIADLVIARNRVRDHYWKMFDRGGHKTRLSFTLDGNLVGDIGESIAVELFGIRLVDSKSHPGIDGYAPDGRSVQVKATGSKLGPAFRPVDLRADHLLFFDLDFDACSGIVAYNGPEHAIIQTLPTIWTGQRLASRSRIKVLDAALQDHERLPLIGDQSLIVDQ